MVLNHHDFEHLSPPPKQMSMSRDTFGCHSWRVLLASSGNAAKHPIRVGQPITTKNYWPRLAIVPRLRSPSLYLKDFAVLRNRDTSSCFLVKDRCLVNTFSIYSDIYPQIMISGINFTTEKMKSLLFYSITIWEDKMSHLHRFSELGDFIGLAEHYWALLCNDNNRKCHFAFPSKCFWVSVSQVSEVIIMYQSPPFHVSVHGEED